MGENRETWKGPEISPQEKLQLENGLSPPRPGAAPHTSPLLREWGPREKGALWSPCHHLLARAQGGAHMSERVSRGQGQRAFSSRL